MCYLMERKFMHIFVLFCNGKLCYLMERKFMHIFLSFCNGLITAHIQG